jgi:hypothetical protein
MGVKGGEKRDDADAIPSSVCLGVESQAPNGNQIRTRAGDDGIDLLTKTRVLGFRKSPERKRRTRGKLGDGMDQGA